MRILFPVILSIIYIGSLFFTGFGLKDNSSAKYLNNMESVESDTLVKMERTVCFGTCPVYELTIQKEGKVTFTGKEFVEQKGMATGEMSEEKLDKLIQKIGESHFFEVSSDPECESRYTDMPSVLLTIELDGQRNSLTHYHGCKGFEYEEELYDLEEAIDSLAGTKAWIEGE